MLLVTVSCATVLGCSHRVEIGLDPPFGLATATRRLPRLLPTIRPPVAFQRGSFVDQRADTTMLTKWQWGYKTFRVYSTSPVSQSLFHGLKLLFEGAGHTWGDSGAIRVDVQLLSVESEMSSGFTTVRGASRVRIKLELVDPRDGQLIYSGTYTGSDAEGYGVEAVVPVTRIRHAIEHAMVSCIQGVAVDSALAETVRRVNSPRP